uniref:Tctex1 domain-containing protein 2-like protein n=1 Tax=Callorhinchus milii TaxID=7868 RepID=V9LBK4_CALMI
MEKRRESLLAVRAAGQRVPGTTKARNNSIPSTNSPPKQLAPGKGRASLGNVLSETHTFAFSFKGLLAARRMTKHLKERTALKIAAKKPAVTKIVNEKVPPFCSNPKEKFRTLPVQKFLEEYLPEKLCSISYCPSIVSALTKEMCDEIKEFVKDVLPPRYKLLCVVTVGEKHSGDALVPSRCLWDSHADTFVSCSYQNSTLFCVANVFTAYCE